MPSLTGALIAGGSILSAGIGAYSSNQAAQTEAQAAENATNTQLSIYDQTKAGLTPYNTAGQSALAQLSSLFGLGTGGPSTATAAGATSALTQYPGYQFGLKQGQSALASSAASQGLLLSGGQLAAQNQYGQNYAMQNAWNPYVSQLSSIAGLGENAAAAIGGVGSSTGSSVANTELAAGQATASGIMGVSNSITGGIQSGLQNAELIALLNGGSLGGGSLSSLGTGALQA